MSAAALLLQHPGPVTGVEFSTDAPACAEDLAAAYVEFLALTEGNKNAAAVLSVGAVLASVLKRPEGESHG